MSGPATPPVVFIVGISYSPDPVGSDKAFLSQILRRAAQRGDLQPVVVSVGERLDEPVDHLSADLPLVVPITYLPRAFHSFSDDPRAPHGHAVHRVQREYLERLASAPELARHLRTLASVYGGGYVHFFDCFGPYVPALLRRAGLRTGVSIFSASDSVYDLQRRLYLRTSLGGAECVVAGSESLAAAYRSIGVRVHEVIPWGPLPRDAADDLPYDERTLVVWSGRMQGTGADQLRQSAPAMVACAREEPRLQAQVWPKPRFAAEYEPIARAEGLETFVPGDEVSRLWGTVRVLVSPVLGPDVIVGPPITWLEVVQAGGVVVTTPHGGGVDPALVEGGNVVVAEGSDTPALVAAIRRAWETPPRTPAPVPDALALADRFIDLWKELA